MGRAWIGLALWLVGCHTLPPEGAVTCDPDSAEPQCPDGWVCSVMDGRCYVSEVSCEGVICPRGMACRLTGPTTTDCRRVASTMCVDECPLAQSCVEGMCVRESCRVAPLAAPAPSCENGLHCWDGQCTWPFRECTMHNTCPFGSGTSNELDGPTLASWCCMADDDPPIRARFEGGSPKQLVIDSPGTASLWQVHPIESSADLARLVSWRMRYTHGSADGWSAVIVQLQDGIEVLGGFQFSYGAPLVPFSPNHHVTADPLMERDWFIGSVQIDTALATLLPDVDVGAVDSLVVMLSHSGFEPGGSTSFDWVRIE